MGALKKVLLGFSGLVSTALATAYFTKKKYDVERDVTINKPKSEIFNYIKYLKNQENFSVWSAMDPNMKKEFKGTDGTVGFVSAWDSDNKNVGKGEQEIKNIIEGERIDYELRFLKPWKAIHPAYLITEEVSSDKTRVKWGFHGRMNFPMNLMLLFMNMEEMIGKDFQTGLNNLKNIMEK
ncbi:SRPBCC family protein [soil metagenome]